MKMKGEGLCLLLFAATTAALEMYSDPNFVGLISRSIISIIFYKNKWEENPRGCFNFPAHIQKTMSSVKADSECVIFYNERLCQGNSFKIEGDVPNIANLVGVSTHDNFDNTATSYRYCNRDEGWKTVDVEIFENPNYSGLSLSYDDVCKCVSLPEELSHFKSINNHHNCVRLYTSDKCSAEEGESAVIFPGKSSMSQDLSQLEIFGRISSFRPCEISPYCFKFKVELYEAEVDESTVAVSRSKASSDFLSMSARTVFSNNGSATVIQEYSARKTVREVTEVSRVNFSRIMTSWESVETTERGVSIGVGFKAKVKKLPVKGSASVGLVNAVESAYSDVCDWAEQNAETYFHEKSTEFAVTQQIEVGPCTMYDVDSFINIQSNFPLEYKMYFRMRGEFAGRQMTAEDLIQELVSMEDYTYNHTIDDYTIAGFATSTITASFGVDTEIKGEGYSIQNCIK